MAKFNIYKIKDGEEANLLARFQQAHLHLQKTLQVQGYDLTFYFSNNPDEVPIWWIQFYKDFLPPNVLQLTNVIYYGVLLIQKGTTLFAASLGKSHFYIRDYIDPDFGLNLAERIANEKDVKMKNTQFFKNKRNKVITSYHNESTIDFESGESMHFLKAKSIDVAKWGKTVNFGQSVLFVLDADYTRLPVLIEDIQAELQKPPRVTLPKVVPITDAATIQELDARLIGAIEHKDGGGSVEESQFALHGVDFVFSDEYEYSFFRSGHFKDKSERGPLTLDRLEAFLTARSLAIRDCLNDIKITVHKEHSRDHSQAFKDYLEYIDEQERICLIDGEWFSFNQSYLDYLRREIDSIECDITSHDQTLPQEKDFLKEMEQDGFKVIHTKLTTVDNKYSIEAGDMIKDKTLYIVKKGQPKQLNYAIDQAIGSIAYLQDKANNITVDGLQYPIDTVCLLLLVPRAEPISHLSDLNSLIFHMKLVDWRRLASNARFIPVVMLRQYTK